MSAAKWGGRRLTLARAEVALWLPTPCGQCGRTVYPDPPGARRTGWVIGHIKSRALHPELTWLRSNWQVEHRACSESSASRTYGEAKWVKGYRAGYAAALAGRPQEY